MASVLRGFLTKTDMKGQEKLSEFFKTIAETYETAEMLQDIAIEHKKLAKEHEKDSTQHIVIMAQYKHAIAQSKAIKLKAHKRVASKFLSA